MNFWQKNENFPKEYLGANIDQIAMRYISMDSTRQALRTNRKLFSNFGIIFRIRYNF